MIRISETFVSRQGEGKLTGTNSFFIRTSGCNLRCWYCDTPYTSWNPEGDQTTIDSLVAAALASQCGHVVLTGGEPLLAKHSAKLSRLIHLAGLHLTVETAGTVFQPIQFDLLSLSPKLASSTPDPGKHPKWSERHTQRRLNFDVMRSLIDRSNDFQVKFVVDRVEDFKEIEFIVERLGVEGSDVWIMPQGISVVELDRSAQWLKPETARRNFQYCDRMHIRWYGNKRGT